MSQLYDAKVKLEKLIAQRGLDEYAIKGLISLRSGVVISLLGPDAPEDPAKLDKLRAAVREVLKTEF